MALKTVWVLLLGAGLVTMTIGLGASSTFDVVLDAEARRGHALVVAASAVLTVAALVGVAVLDVPWWVAGLILLPVVVCLGGVLASDWLPLVFVVVLYPCVTGAVVGGLLVGRPP